MSNQQNTDILERLYEEVKDEFPNEHPLFLIHEARKRFEELPEPGDYDDC